MKKRLLAMLLAVMMIAALGTVTAAADENNYVEIKATYNEDWIQNGGDSSNRKSIADVVLNEHYDTLKAASDAVGGLYATTGGNYNLGGDFPEAGPFYYRASDEPTDAERSPLSALEFIIHGTVPSGLTESTESINLGTCNIEGRGIFSQGFRISDVKLTGHGDNAKITGYFSVSVNVAGGYEETFVNKGSFTVSNIEFTSGSGNTRIEANGNTNNKPDNENRAEETKLTIENCVFHNQLYSYVNDPDSDSLVKIIRNNKFIAGEGVVEGNYAYFLQGQGTECVFEDNIVTGYSRGVNIQFESNDGVVRIVDNDIEVSNDSRPAIQLTNAKEAYITGNKLTNDLGPAIWFYNNGEGVTYSADKTEIVGNTINSKEIFKNGNGEESQKIDFGDGKELVFSLDDNTVSTDINSYESGLMVPIHVTFSGSGHGSVAPNVLSDNTIPVVIGADQTIKIQPSGGSYISDVIVNGESKGAVEEVTFYNLNLEQSLKIVFGAYNIPDTYDIDLIVSDGGSAKTNLSNASVGTTITVTATPDEGYELDYITVDGERISGTTFKMPAHDVTVRVYFTDGTSTLPFTDVRPNQWFYDAISYVYTNGMMEGDSATTFNPDGQMTRAMVWAILARIDGETVTGANWIDTARTWAMSEGVSDGTDPTGLVTREQLATMLWRYAGEPESDYSLAAYTDASSVSDWAAEAMAWAVENGIVTGVTATTLDPQGTATRAQCAAILMRYAESF